MEDCRRQTKESDLLCNLSALRMRLWMGKQQGEGCLASRGSNCTTYSFLHFLLLI